MKESFWNIFEGSGNNNKPKNWKWGKNSFGFKKKEIASIVEALIITEKVTTSSVKVAEKASQSQEQGKKRALELALNIHENISLVISKDQLASYPPVPTYIVPQWIGRTAEQIRAFETRKEKEKRELEAKQEKENGTFVDCNIFVGDTPIEIEDYNSMDTSLSKFGPIGKDLTVFLWHTHIIQGRVQMLNYSYPQLIEVVWSTVSVIADNSDTVQLVGIYVLRDCVVIRKLLKALKDLKVYNIDNLYDTCNYLEQVALGITPKE